MKFLKNNMWTLFALAFVFTMALTGDASAQGATIAATAKNKALNVFQNVKTMIFIVGGFGLVGLAFAAVFGKLNWKWFASLAVGLAILAAAGSLIQYATGDTQIDASGQGGFGDTFSNASGN